MYPFLKSCLPTVAIRGRNSKRPWRKFCLTSKLKSSSALITPKVLSFSHAVGSSNVPLRGSTVADGSRRTGRTSIARRCRSCASHQSASCCENFVIRPDVPGQTLSVKWRCRRRFNRGYRSSGPVAVPVAAGRTRHPCSTQVAVFAERMPELFPHEVIGRS